MRLTQSCWRSPVVGGGSSLQARFSLQLPPPPPPPPPLPPPLAPPEPPAEPPPELAVPAAPPDGLPPMPPPLVAPPLGLPPAPALPLPALPPPLAVPALALPASLELPAAPPPAVFPPAGEPALPAGAPPATPVPPGSSFDVPHATRSTSTLRGARRMILRCPARPSAGQSGRRFLNGVKNSPALRGESAEKKRCISYLSALRGAPRPTSAWRVEWGCARRTSSRGPRASGR
jgi:hypothetical protein